MRAPGKACRNHVLFPVPHAPNRKNEWYGNRGNRFSGSRFMGMIYIATVNLPDNFTVLA